MKRLLVLSALLFALGLGAISKAQVGLPFPGPGTAHTTTTSYQGPGDIVPSALFWVGLRAYNLTNADGTHKSVALKRESDSHTCDLLISTAGNTLGTTTNCSTGGENGTAPATWCNATTCRITTWYDQSGNSRDFVAVSATSSNQMRLNTSPIGAEWFTTTEVYCTSGSFAAAQQSTASLVMQSVTSNGSPSGLGSAVAYGGGFTQVGWNSANTWFIYDGSLVTTTVSDSAYHAVQAVFNGASSDAYVDGSSNTLNAGTGSSSSATACIGATNSGGTNNMTNTLLREVGAWGSGFSSGNKSAMNSNQHGATNGWNF